MRSASFASPLFELEIRSQPDREQLTEELRPCDRRGAQPAGGDIIQRGKVGKPHVRIVSPTTASSAAAEGPETNVSGPQHVLGGATGPP
jgi:hypothetical protein